MEFYCDRGVKIFDKLICGIFVAFNYNNREFSEAEFISATSQVSHRGPDNFDFISDGKCFLGHTRLTIIDLEKGANQPLYFQNLIIVYNGEIFNYIELGEELIALGYSFDTNSDTEVAIKSYHKCGGDCFSKFNGMWSLAIYDKNKVSIIAARDRFGQKPLFVLQEEDSIFFVSESFTTCAIFKQGN